MSESSQSRSESAETPQAASGTSKADADHDGETASPESASVRGISDEQLPEDLQPNEDNPLAQPLDPDDESTKSREELEMDATQEEDDRVATGGANSGEGAQGDGIAEG